MYHPSSTALLQLLSDALSCIALIHEHSPQALQPMQLGTQFAVTGLGASRSRNKVRLPRTWGRQVRSDLQRIYRSHATPVGMPTWSDVQAAKPPAHVRYESEAPISTGLSSCSLAMYVGTDDHCLCVSLNKRFSPGRWPRSNPGKETKQHQHQHQHQHHSN